MRCAKLATVRMMGIALAVVMLCGCSTDRVSLSDQGLVSVAKQDSEKVAILWTDVYEQDGHTWLYVVLEQRMPAVGMIQTHVDVQVLDPDGAVVYEVTTAEVPVPRHCAAKGPNWKRFRVQLPDELPDDCQISVIVHSGSHRQAEET